MPHYYFDVTDEETIADDIGVRLSNLKAAKTEALRLGAELLREQPERFGEDGRLRIAIRSDEQALVARVELIARWTGLAEAAEEAAPAAAGVSPLS